ncbi:MAG: glycosyltransferase family 4 protein [Eubacterium sp.]
MNEKKVQNRRIVVDARMINMSGIGTYIKNNINAGLYTDALGNEQEIHDVDTELNVIEYREKIYGVKEQLKFPYKVIKKIKPDVLHVPHYNIPIFYKGKMVVTIHDLIHLVYPEFLPNKFAYWYAKIMIGIAIKKAYKIITVSEYTKKDIMKYYKHTNPEKIVVTYETILPQYKEIDKKELAYLYEKFNVPKDKKLVMYVGNIKPHKNLKRLLEAFSKIDNIENTLLLLVGKSFKQYDLDDIEQELNISNKVIHTGIVTDEELVGFYNLADLFVFPSLYEGFGLPPLEAMACGTPVIASNTSSMPEVLGDAAHYFDPLCIEEITSAINEELAIKKEDNPLIKKGFQQVKKNYELFDYEKIKECLM